MRSVFVFVVVGIFFVALSAYVYQNFSPFNLEKINELIDSSNIPEDEPETLEMEIQSIVSQGLVIEYLSNNAYLVFSSILSAGFCFLCAVHLFIDKVFFKSIWQKPSMYDATRRSLLITLTLGLLVYLKLLNVDTTTLILIPVSAFVIEIILNSFKHDFNNLVLNFKKTFNKPLSESDQGSSL